jgi:ATP-dependent helicase/nuclease subunit B
MDLNLEAKPFLKRLAEQVVERGTDAPHLLIVLPNRRSQFVLRAFLDELLTDQAEQVQLITVDDLMEQLSDLKMIEPEELLIAFYSAYCKLEKTPQSFDQFSAWATSFLTDANDVDLHMGDMNQLLHQINDYHQTGEYFKDGSPGPIERDYLTFWQRLPKYYKVLRDELSQLELAYRGLIYRKVAELSEQDSETLKAFFTGKTIYWVGVIPGNPSEQKLLHWLKEKGELEIFADVDKFYVEHKAHEAGKLFRSGAFANETKWPVNLLLRKAYQFDVHPMPNVVGQLLEVKHILKSIPESDYANTVVVLADEKLLSPFLEMFADERPYLNITTGYPLKNTLIHRFIMSWIQLHAGALQRSNDVMFYHKHLEEFLEYAIIKNWLGGAANWALIKQKMVAKNLKFVSRNWLAAQLGHDLFAVKAFELLFNWPKEVSAVFQLINDVLVDWKKNTEKLGFAPIEVQALPVYIQKLKLLLSQFSDLLPESDLKALRKFVHRQVGYSKIYLEEPENKCIQVMGMLETRMIDFENVIIVGAADDTLPGSPNRATHIPFIHRVNYGLPTRQESEALIAYHFYRLMQRANHVHLIYSTSTTAMSGGEASRYVLQLQEELSQLNKNLKLNFVYNKGDHSLKPAAPLQVEKTLEVIADIEQALKRVSPSALNRFIDSPLEFYFSYVLRLREQDKVEEDVEASTFGSIVHNTIENLYKPFEGSVLTEKVIDSMMPLVDEQVMAEFHDKFEPSLLETGKNKIQVELAKNWVKLFLKFDADDIKKHGPIELIKLELRLGGEFDYNHLKVNLNSFADRVDKRNGKIRIVDYKTGKVEENDLKATWNQIQTKIEYSKALQLAFYSWAYAKRYGGPPEQIESVIFSFRNKKSGYLPLVINPEKGQPAMDFKVGFESVMTALLDEMFDTSKPFAHRETTKYPVF